MKKTQQRTNDVSDHTVMVALALGIIILLMKDCAYQIRIYNLETRVEQLEHR